MVRDSDDIYGVYGGSAQGMQDKWSSIVSATEPVIVPPAGKDAVNHPTHYTSHPSGVECIQVVEHMNFNLGNAIKYLWRASLKGKEKQDLEKAAWYINREIQRVYGKK